MLSIRRHVDKWEDGDGDLDVLDGVRAVGNGLCPNPSLAIAIPRPFRLAPGSLLGGVGG